MVPITEPLDSDSLNDAERAFLDGVFAHLKIQGSPTVEQFKEGLAVMSAYAMQRQDNPSEDGDSPQSDSPVYGLTDRDRLMIAAVAFMRFGVTKPTSRQWTEASLQLFGPQLRVVTSHLQSVTTRH